MDCERYLQPLEVISFLIDNGGQVTHSELIDHFKPLLDVNTEIGRTNFAYLKR